LGACKESSSPQAAGGADATRDLVEIALRENKEQSAKIEQLERDLRTQSRINVEMVSEIEKLRAEQKADRRTALINSL
jgi:hypothetical protein